MRYPLSLVLLGMTLSLQSQLVISEASPFGDWIELRNDGADVVDAGGFGLADGIDEAPWIVPAMQLMPGEHWLIEASGEDITVTPSPWFMPIVESSAWDYILPNTNLSPSWRLPGFTPMGWSSGPGGIGYGDNDDATTVSQTNAVYLRQTFEIDDPADWGFMSLAVDYDDGFVAYLNGVEIARSETMIGVTANAESYANANHEAAMYAGGLPEQWSWEASEFSDWLVSGENVLAIQAYNVGDNSSDFSIRPFLGLTPIGSASNPWAEAPNWWPEVEGTFATDFQLSVGETVVLFNPDGTLANALPIPPDLPSGYSVGRPDGEATEWCLYASPTPGEPNGTQSCLTGVAATPVPTVPSGWYSGDVLIQLMPMPVGTIVRYTTNGDEPHVFSPPFPEGGLVLEETTALSLKTWAIDGSLLPSPVRDETYILNEFTPDLPTFSILTDDFNLWDWNTGIYVFGPNASGDYPYFGANFWQPWSRYARMLFFDANGQLQAREQLDLEIHGGWSRAEPQRSFRLDFKNEYSGDFAYPLFSAPDAPVQFNNLNLRNGGQHSWATKFQDGLISTLANETHNVASAWQPAHLYLNGDYWGLYGAREKTDEHFIAERFGTQQEDVDLVGPFAVLNGSDADLIAAAAEMEAIPTSNSGFFNAFAEHFDVANYIDYFVFETYTQNTDWIGIAWGLNNVKVFRAAPDEPWRYLLYDTDASFGFFGASVWDNFIQYARNPGFPNLHSNLFDRVLDNTEFRHRFINRYADLVNTIFQPAAFNARVEACIDLTTAAMVPHIQRWSSPASNSVWLNAINTMSAHNANRVPTARQHLMNSFGLPDSHECTLAAFPPVAGKVRVNTIVPGPLPWEGIYFESCPIELEAIAEANWMFDRWDVNAHVESGDMDQYTKVNVVNLHTSDLYRARFVPCPLDAEATILEGPDGFGIATSNIPYVDSILWHLDGVLLGMAATWTPTQSGSYTATVYFDGCTATTPQVESDAVYVSAAPEVNGPWIVPNPANEVIQVHMQSSGLITFCNARGQVMWESSVSAVPSEVRIDTKTWPEGMYFMRSGPVVQKLIIQH